jgi:glycosyltransferase involved in cell wall biosynthesis
MPPPERDDRHPALRGKRVVLVLAWSVFGGGERSALSTATYLKNAAAARVEVLALTEEDGRAKTLFEAAGIPWSAAAIPWQGSKHAKAAELVDFLRTLRRMRPDVLLPYTTRPNVLCGLAWRAAGASVAVWNQQDVGIPTKFGPRIRALAVRSTPVFVANSTTASEFLVDTYGAPRNAVHVVLQHVGPRRYDEEMRRDSRAALDLEHGVPVVVMLAHLHRVKDHATLLRAWRAVVDEPGLRDRPPVLLLAGRFSGTADAAKALAFDLDLGRTVRFLGDVENVDTVLAASDVGVLTSLSESRPHAVLEYRAAGLAIVASDIPGVREALGERQHEWLVPPGDVPGFTRALTALLEDVELRERLATANQEWAAADGSHPGVEIARLLEGALAGPRFRRCRR